MRRFRDVVAAWSSLLLLAGLLLVQQLRPAQAQIPATTGDASKVPDYQLDSLVAPIALYPDPLLSQALVASTYPLEIMQLQQFLQSNPYLKDQALGDAVAKQPWDPSIQGLAIFPDAVTRLSGDLNWTTDLGNAFLAHQSGVMDAIQRMRARAVEKGTLQTSPQQKVETETAENGEQVTTIEPADPEMVYVPYYDPTMAYGALPYPYPPIYYPPPGYYQPGAALAFAIAVALGKAWNGGWGYGFGWGRDQINLLPSNKFVRNSTVNSTGTTNGLNRSGSVVSGTTWQHNPVHRGGTPYASRQLADKYGSVIGGPGNGNGLGGGVRGDQLGGGRPGDRTGPATVPATRPSGGSVGNGNRVGSQISYSWDNTGAFDGGGRDVSHASHDRGAASMGGGGFRGGGGGGGGRGGGRRR